MADSRVVGMALFICFFLLAVSSSVNGYSLEVEYNPDRPLSRMQLHRQLTALNSAVNISVTPQLLGSKGESSEWVTVTFSKTKGAAVGDFIAVFSPAKFDGKECALDPNSTKTHPPSICNAPIKFEYANFTSPKYAKEGKGSLTVQLINMRSDFAFGFFSGDVGNPVLEGISNVVKFKNPKAPQWPRLALGKEWNEMTVTWTSGYCEAEARPLVAWKWEDDADWKTSLASTVTYKKSDMCGPPASTVGWHDPGYIHTAYLKELGPSAKYFYKVGHKLKDGKYVWGEENFFKSAPNVGEPSLQRVVVYGDMGKKAKDNWMEYNDNQPGALVVTDALIKDLDNYDIILSNGDITYADGYLSEWDTFADQVTPFTKRVPYMVSIGNHERDYPGTGSYYTGHDSGGECGVVTPTVFPMPGENNAKLWYAANWGAFKFCIGNSEIDWTIGSEQHKFLEHCLSSTDRSKQPWLVFLMHRVVGYSSASDYQQVWGTFGEPNGRSNLEDLWQRYKVDLAFYGHVHSYERSFPVYQSVLVSDEPSHYSGRFNGTIHIVAGTGGRALETFGPVNTTWSNVKNDQVNGYVKMTSSNSQNLLVEFLNAIDGSVVDSFTIERKYQDVLGCDNSIAPLCPKVSSVDYS